MATRVRRFGVGGLELAVIDEGTSRYPVADWPGVTPAEMAPFDVVAPDGTVLLGMNLALVRSPAGPLLLDAGFGEDSEWLRAFSARFNIVRKGDAVAALAELDLAPADICHVVISHAHGDHFFGATLVREGRHVPACPNARYWLGAADWTRFSQIQPAGSPFQQIVGALHRLGRLTLVDAETEVVPGVSLLPTPGESPGHLAIRLESNGQIAYYIGDLIHHIAEVYHPEWIPNNRDAASLTASRRAFYARAAAENALVVASHVPFPGAGRIVASGTGWAWEPVA